MGDSANPWCDGYTPIWERDIWFYLYEDWHCTCWHNEQNDYLYADGHVKSGRWSGFTWDQIWLTQVRKSHSDYGRPVTQRMAQPPW